MTGLPHYRYNAALRRPIFLARRKDGIMLNILKSLMAMKPANSITERERAYLEASVSRIDLERREREIDSGLFRQPHPYY
jgi:hypothetical protein